MEKPRIKTADGVEHEMQPLTGRSYRVAAEFDKNLPEFGSEDFIERHAAVIAELFGVSVDDALDMPLEDIIPAARDARKFAYAFTWLKTGEISKNSQEDKEQ